MGSRVFDLRHGCRGTARRPRWQSVKAGAADRHAVREGEAHRARRARRRADGAAHRARRRAHGAARRARRAPRRADGAVRRAPRRAEAREPPASAVSRRWAMTSSGRSLARVVKPLRVRTTETSRVSSPSRAAAGRPVVPAPAAVAGRPVVPAPAAVADRPVVPAPAAVTGRPVVRAPAAAAGRPAVALGHRAARAEVPRASPEVRMGSRSPGDSPSALRSASE
ncbi:MAG: hypothetical protein QOF49_2357 [Chloroflexota bacterium]|nr:hypothetical protein [Chloroflexota bacterium]